MEKIFVRVNEQVLFQNTTHSLIVAIIPCWDSISSLRAESCFWWASRWLIICFSSADCNETQTVWIIFFYTTTNTVQKTREDSALPSNWILRNVQYKMTNEEFKGINDCCEKNSKLHLGKTNKLLISWRYTIKTHICALPVDRTEVKSSRIRINHVQSFPSAFHHLKSSLPTSSIWS